jgi:peptide/nickel transport system ATP-binding protein
MYAGQIVEYADVHKIFKNPIHPYTKGLLEALPQAGIKKKRLKEIPGTLPDLTKETKGCLFYPRCRQKEDRCFGTKMFLREIEPGHWVRCIKKSS